MDIIQAAKIDLDSSAVIIEEINHSFQAFKEQSEKLCQEEKDCLEEEQRKITELQNKIQDQQEKLSVEEQKLKTLTNDMSQHIAIIKELEREYQRLLMENHSQEEARKELELKCMKPNEEDEKLLHHGRQTLDYYKVLTGVRWDYATMKDSVKGCVTDREKYVHAFKYKKNDSSIDSKVWKEIEKCVNSLNNMELSNQKENSDPN